MSEKRLTEIAEQSQECLTKYTGVISSDHAYIHDGKAFTAILSTGSISAVYRVGFTTPSVASGKFVHWRPLEIKSSADYVDIQLTEDDSFTGGATITPINRNRLSADTSNMQTFSNGVTSTPTGILIQATGIGVSGNIFSQSGGGSGEEQELVLKQNTSYVITLTPGGATTVRASLFWYEEDAGIDG